MPPRNSYLRLSLLAALSAWVGDVSALGLGELNTHSFLGEPFTADVEVLTTGKEVLDAGCFHLRSPQGDDDLPWLRRGSFNLRRGSKLMLEIRSEVPLRDPVLQVGISVGCGHEVQRDYTLFLSPRGKDVESPVQPATMPAVAPPQMPTAATRRQPAPLAANEPPAPRLTPRRIEKRTKPLALPDRLVLSSGGDSVGEPSLRLATELLAWKEDGRAGGEAQREILRLEYRMLAAMNEQATTQLAAAEKLRNMEATLADLQQRASDFTGRIEKGAAPAAPAAPVQAVPASSPAAEMAASPATLPTDKPKSEAAPPHQTLISEWSFYGAMLGAVLGVGGWLGWRQYRERRTRRVELDEPIPEPVIAPPKSAEFDDFDEVDFHVEPAAAKTATQVDVPLDTEDVPPAPVEVPLEPVEVPEAVAVPNPPESRFEASGATVDEHFEVNPVMELAEIMLSFGRVKGAAQALQEYIDHNPEEALQPWIRLMDVYRMAGMRDEFDHLAQDLNRHFNVEVQHWSDDEGGKPQLDEPLDFILDTDEDMVPPLQIAPPKALTLEDIEHIRTKLIECWGGAECLGYLNQLLRDNRGGKRSGFTLPVVEEILFLIELLETRNSMESKNGGKNE